MVGGKKEEECLVEFLGEEAKSPKELKVTL